MTPHPTSSVLDENTGTPAQATPLAKPRGGKVSVGLVDNYLYFLCPGQPTYERLNIPTWVPPECIVLSGFAFACLAALSFSFATTYSVAGLFAAFFVYCNFVSDYMDGRHARTTNQCRNGGELLDHVMDCHSFAAIAVGIAASVGRLDLALVQLVTIYGSALTVFQEAMMLKTLTLQAIGPNEARFLYILIGLLLPACLTFASSGAAETAVVGFLYGTNCLSAFQLVNELIHTINRVNKFGPPPDVTPWVRSRDALPELVAAVNKAN